MASLQRGVLAVVRKAEQLARTRIERRFLPEMTNGREAENSGRGAPSLGSEGRQLPEIGGRPEVIGYPAMKSEPEWTLHEMTGVAAHVFFAIGACHDGTRQVLLPPRLDARTLIRVFDPVLWQF